MEEAEFLSDRIAVINDGLIRAIGTSSYLKREFCDFVVVEFIFDQIRPKFVHEFVSEFEGEVVYQFEGLFKVKIDSKTHGYAKILKFIEDHADANMKNWSIKKGSLEDVFNYIEKNY